MRAALPTGLLALDVASYIGGHPHGNLVEIYGDPTSGKTTLALLACASAQRAGGTAAYLDVEGTLDAGYAAALGVDTAALLLGPARTGEQAFEVGVRLLAAVDVLVLDAVASLLPAAEIEGRIGDAPPGAQRRLVAAGVRRLYDAAAQRGAVVICVNQIRHQKGPQGWHEVTAGGALLPSRAAMRVELRRAETPEPVRITVVKNTYARAAAAGAVTTRWGQGFEAGADLVAAALRVNVLAERAGVLWFEGRAIGPAHEAVVLLAGTRRGEAVREAVLEAAPWRRAQAFAPI